MQFIAEENERFCKSCIEQDPARTITLKPPARKSTRKRNVQDYANLDAGLGSDSKRFLRMMEGKLILPDPFKRMNGADVNLNWLEEDDTAMLEPIIIEKPDGLGMKMPPGDFTADDVASELGEHTPLEVMDVASQSDSPGWTLGKWADYVELEPSKRERIYNVISLEVSGTKIAEGITPPKIVRDLDWVETFWPSTRKGKGNVYPKVQLYCLMGVETAWTDWHIDFAGSSVYYHILSGSKVFYFIRPTSENLAAYEKWSGSELQNHTWLGDMADAVYKVELKAGNTMIIPAGWIHAVYTPMDTMVFGGNFLHSYNTATQIRVRNIEIATQVPKKFRFPMFSRLCWYVGDKYLRDFRSHPDFSERIIQGIIALSEFLVAEVRILENGSEQAKKEVKEQIPADRVKDAPALARELRWRARMASGYSSDGEEEQSTKPLGLKRKRSDSEAPMVSSLFKNFKPKKWDASAQETESSESRRVKPPGMRPGAEGQEDWTGSWLHNTGSEEADDDGVELKRRKELYVKVRRTEKGVERQQIRCASHRDDHEHALTLSSTTTMDPYNRQHANYDYNRSVPSIQTPEADVNAAFASMSIGGPPPVDPIQRSHSAMSMQSGPHHQQHPPPRRHAATLPPDNAYYNNDYSAAPYDPHNPNSYPPESHNSSYSYNDYYYQEQQQYPQHPQHPQQQRQWNPNAGNSFYAAASDVLGGGPPPGASHQPHPPSGYYADPTPPGTHQHRPTLAPPSGYYADPTSPGNYSDTYSINSRHSSVDAFPPQQAQEADFELRGPVRKATSLSTNQNGQSSKAIDLSSPPFTKEYIDQYRQRIKADPDPEAHFLYAKYLVDAAKRFRAAAKDPRAGKKYSEVLITEALKVIRRLATQGEAYHEAQFFLANCHGTGALGLPVDHEKAYHLYLQAAKQNNAAAAYRVAVCNEIGAGTRRDPPRAAAFYRKAASLGDTAAMYKLGMILLQGLLEQSKDPREAIAWLKRAGEQADEENPHALHELALLYEQPASSLVPHDPGYAKALYTQGAQLGYTPSQYKLGQCYEYGSLGCPIDPKRSIAWYTKAAERGDAEAELALSGWYLTGSEGVLKQSDSEAYLWARRAANKALSKAEYAVGYYAEVGIGIKQDIEFAKRWYMRAAAQGNKRAMNRLTEMKRMGNKRPTDLARPTRQQAKDECVIL
ncbi:hypothetical protein EST38_g12569 [Candolleomyces aberdarensis]|uniref:JmjC domain-containing protein n=1 Tax=Candolleomyces aberdarensis TaxID=2316362 RepID=A0A4Q2D549_9AGAR|nr:hypothetical protein EST38_g12569 [Candolleomyces aberdarensis]